jgi:GDP-D-mannose 3', 5'-epimerase
MLTSVGLDPTAPVVVTGAGGLIGGHLASRLIDEGFSVRAVDCRPFDEWEQWHAAAENLRLDLREPDACRKAVDGMALAFNLAADMGGMGFIEHNRALCMLSVVINTHLLVASDEADVERFFFASSACVYAAGKQASTDVVALREEDAYPAMPEDGYGWEKLFSERMCRHFYEDFGLQTRVARYHNVYGPHGCYEGGREKAPAAICRKVAQAKLSGAREIEIWGDGRQARSFTYIDDGIEGTLRLMASDVADPINVGSSELVTVDELTDLVEEIAGVRLQRRYRVDAPQGVRGRNSDNSRARELLGWEPATRVREGIEATYAWIYDQLVARAR